MQKCKSAGGLWKGGKVRGGVDHRVQRTEYGLQRTVSCEDSAKVQIGLRPVQRCAWAKPTRGQAGKGTGGQGVVSPLGGGTMFEVGSGLRTDLGVS